MLLLVGFIGVSIGSFAFRYMKGDLRYSLFFVDLTLLIISIGIVVSSDDLSILFGGWCLSNFLLVKLMIHKSNWRAAKNSGLFTAKNYLFGGVCIGTGLILLNYATGEFSIKAIVHTPSLNPTILLALTFLLIGAMTQSAIWPFHRWLISSLNSPTPVSALMHAGLVNGGGFLLARFAPLYLKSPYLLNLIFIIGISTALTGTLWKLIQNDVKRMLACSTMGQMGFMLAQCGLGLFPSAVAHLVTHGMFKAYLFLASGSAAVEKRYDSSYSTKVHHFFLSLMCGFLGSYWFSLASGEKWNFVDTRLVLLIIAFLYATQSALQIFSLRVRFRIPLAVILTSIMSLVYGGGIRFITAALEPMEIMQPQPLNVFHVCAVILLVLSWLLVFFLKNGVRIPLSQQSIIKGYVRVLNASQPYKETVTTHRSQYKYM